MKYTINGKTYSNLKAVHREHEIFKYSVREGSTLNWINTGFVIAIFKKFGMNLKKGFKAVITQRRTLGGRILIALNQKTGAEIHLSVSKVIKKANFGKTRVKLDSDGDVIMKD